MIDFEDIEYYLYDNNLREMIIENDEIYDLIEKITNFAYPTNEDQYDKRWRYFYLPLLRGNENIAVPVWIMEYHKEFFITVKSFNIQVKKGNLEIDRFYKDIFEEILRFVPIIKKDGLKKINIPYEIRTGKIKGKYVLDRILSQDRKKEILDKYKVRIKKKLDKISLNDYLNVAAICYRAAYKKETENLSNIEMYKKWADGRDGGMFSIKDWDSGKEFYEWYSGGYSGHPFEIVFSWHEHGIHLYPDFENNCYTIRVTNYVYARDFINMVEELIKLYIPFKAYELDNVLDFLAGDTYFNVNNRYVHCFMYYDTEDYKRKYFDHIEWDDIEIVKWK